MNKVYVNQTLFGSMVSIYLFAYYHPFYNHETKYHISIK